MPEIELTRLTELAVEVLWISVIGGLGVSLLVRSAGVQMVGLADLWGFLAVWTVAVAADYFGGQAAVGLVRVLYGTLLALGVLMGFFAVISRLRKRRGDEAGVGRTEERPVGTDLEVEKTLGELDLMKRIEQLERTVEYLKGALQRAAPGAEPSRTLEVEQLVIQDAKGNRRAEVGLYSEGRAVGLRLFDQAGQTRSELAVNADGSPILRLCDQAGKVRGGLGVTPDGWPLLALFDQSEKSRAHLSVKADGSPDLNFRDQAGAVRADLFTASDGSPSLALFGENKETLFAAP